MSQKSEKKTIINYTNDHKVILLILLILVVIILFPLFMEHFILSNEIISVISNGEWSAFLGSYIGGAIGGVGTLLAVYITTKDTKFVMGKTISNLKLDRTLNEYKERKMFTDEIAKIVAEFSTDMNKFALTCYRHQEIFYKKKSVQEHLNTVVERINERYSKGTSGILGVERAHTDSLNKRRAELEFELNILSEKLEEALKQIDRTTASNHYFVVKIKLSNHSNSVTLLNLIDDIYMNTAHNSETSLEWIREKTDELIIETQLVIAELLKEVSVKVNENFI